MQSFRQAFQQRSLVARRKRAFGHWHREANRRLRLRERELRLAYQAIVHRQRMAERQQRIDAAQHERVDRHRAMLRRRARTWRSV